MRNAALLLVPSILLFSLSFGAVRTAGAGDLAAAAKSAAAGDANGVALLRSAGPAGLAAFKAAVSEDHPRYDVTLDQVCAQRDCRASDLFWYTDIEQAKAAARTEGKPILTLRLLGRLDEDFSCANSRFFRTTLYPDARVSKHLRENFILHWKSVRPAPRITIDMGDGRKIERTITGNSAHYVLDAKGRVVDALPGLYGPGAFLRVLGAAESIARTTVSMPASERESALRSFHGKRADAIAKAWAKDLGAAAGSQPDALEKATRDAEWRAIAAKHSVDARLDTKSRTLIAERYPSAETAMPIAATKAVVESPMLRQIRSFERSLGLDTMKNEYLLHRKIHERFAQGQAGDDADALNEWVYDALFLTPTGDPWLGMIPADAFPALPKNGVVSAR